MFVKINLLLVTILLSCSLLSNAQIEVARISVKDFKAIGFGSFLNFSVPVSEANYVTIEGGLQVFTDKYDESVVLAPVLLGYRYTLNQIGTGLYVEPNAGYTFGSTDVAMYDKNGSPLSNDAGWAYEKVAGPTAGVGVGYLFEPGGKVQFNLGLRYQHSFGSAATNVLSFRISHAFSFGRRNDEY